MWSVCGLLALGAALAAAGPLPNVTSGDIGLKEGSCALGDVVYVSGEEVPGASACERCRCAGGGVRCERRRCEARPGCKALHRPDQCCPIYQCECEQEGRVYGNGEKLVDPADPCRVCYCQGGEVVCRRIACFVRDDCSPRLVPGRCCPEYDNCPLRGMTTVSGAAPSMSSISTEEAKGADVPPVPKENIKQEITIKEITPVSEIPVITEVKIKEILPSPGMEVAEYASSKSPLIPREATSETPSSEVTFSRTDSPVIVEIHHSSPTASPPSDFATKSSETIFEMNKSDDSTPSKISLSTQDSINSEIYPSVPSVAAASVPVLFTPDVLVAVTSSKTPIIEEEDPSLFADHNPAFPPIPDDLSVLSNHEDEILPEQNIDSESVSRDQDVVRAASVAPTEPQITKDPLTTTKKTVSEVMPLTTDGLPEYSVEITSIKSEVIAASTDPPKIRESPMLNLRSAIPTEILNEPSLVPEIINGELDDVADTTTADDEPVTRVIFTRTADTSEDRDEGRSSISSSEFETTSRTSRDTTDSRETTPRVENSQEQTTISIPKSNVATEEASQTELSSLPIETSDQNPHEASSDSTKSKEDITTVDPFDSAEMSTKISSFNPEVITVSRASSSAENQPMENIETTEFIITPFGSSESATDTIEMIKISAEPERSAALLESANAPKNNVLTDLINLVGDVASISEHTAPPRLAAGISDSEELIPVNAGYKSKNSNRNVNSITEVPHKSKGSSVRQKVVEIEDDESDGLTDSPPPFDRVEPTTRRPIIDNVSDDRPDNRTESKDIEIITQSYVPTLGRRPTKVLLHGSDERPGEAGSSTAADQ